MTKFVPYYTFFLKKKKKEKRKKKTPPANAGHTGLIPESGKSSGEGNSMSLQDSCLENPMDRGAWGLAKSQTQLCDSTTTTTSSP